MAILNRAAVMGNLKSVEWLVRNIFGNQVIESFLLAVKEDHIHVVEFLAPFILRDDKVKVYTEAFSSSTEHGCPNVLQWLVEQDPGLYNKS